MSPYNLNPNTIARWKEVLDTIANNYGHDVVVTTDNPHITAYSLREALHAAKHHNIYPYCEIEYQFTEDNKKGEVVCRPKKGTSVLSIGVQAKPENTYPDAVSAFDVVEIATMEKADMMTFPSFSDDVESVRSWAESRGYEINSTKPLTLRKMEN